MADVVEKVLCEHEDFDGCLISARKFLKNKPQDKSTYEKLMRRLIGQGYNYETIKSVLNQLKFECDDL